MDYTVTLHIFGSNNISHLSSLSASLPEGHRPRVDVSRLAYTWYMSSTAVTYNEPRRAGPRQMLSRRSDAKRALSDLRNVTCVLLVTCTASGTHGNLP